MVVSFPWQLLLFSIKLRRQYIIFSYSELKSIFVYIVLNEAFHSNCHDFVLYKDIKGSFKNFYTKTISHANLSQCKHPVKTFQVLRILCVFHAVF